MGRPKNYDRDEVIDLAMELFWLKGYAATSIADLAEVTGLNKKSLYNEFGSKEELFNAAFAHYTEKKMPLIALLLREPYGTKNIVDYFTAVAAEATPKGCLLVLSIAERSLLEEKACQQVESDFNGLRQLLEMNLAEAFKGSTKDPAPIALLLCSQIFSIAGMGKIGVSKDQIKKSIEQLLSQLF